MDDTAIIAARRSGTSFAELARVSGKSQLDVRRIVAQSKRGGAPQEPPINEINRLHQEIAVKTPIKAEEQDPAVAIEASHRATCASMKNTCKHAIETGRLLIDQKAKLPYGGWIPWIKANLSFGISLANKYMSAYRNYGHLDSERIPNLPLNGLAKGDKSKVREPKKPKLTKSLTFTHAVGKDNKVKVVNPLSSWFVAHHGDGYPAIIVCRKCKDYTQGGIGMAGEHTGFIVSCRCENSTREVEPAEEDK